MKITHEAFTLNIFNENFINFVEINGAHLFKLKSLVNNVLTLSNDKNINLSTSNALLVSDFISNNTTRELFEFKTYEEAKEAAKNEKNSGVIFSQDRKECFYVYNK